MVKVAEELGTLANSGQLTGGPDERYDATEKNHNGYTPIGGIVRA